LQTKVGRVIQTSVCVRLENKAASIKARRMKNIFKNKKSFVCASKMKFGV